MPSAAFRNAPAAPPAGSGFWTGRDPSRHRIIVCDPSGRWLAVLRQAAGWYPGAAELPRRHPARAITAALDPEDAVIQSRAVPLAVVAIRLDPRRLAEAIREIRRVGFGDQVRLVALGGPELAAWRHVLVEAGFADGLTSLTQADRLFRLAQDEPGWNCRPPLTWRQEVARLLPWPRHATGSDWLVPGDSPLPGPQEPIPHGEPEPNAGDC